MKRRLVVLMLCAALLIAVCSPPKADAALESAVLVPVLAVGSTMVAAVLYTYCTANGLEMRCALQNAAEDLADDTWSSVEGANALLNEYLRERWGGMNSGDWMQPNGPDGNDIFMSRIGGLVLSFDLVSRLQAFVEWVKSKYDTEDEEEPEPVVVEEPTDDSPYSKIKVHPNPTAGTTFRVYEGDYDFQPVLLLDDNETLFAIAVGSGGLNTNVNFIANGTMFGLIERTFPSGRIFSVEKGSFSYDLYLSDELGVDKHERSATVMYRSGTYTQDVNGFYLCYFYEEKMFYPVWYGRKVNRTYTDYYKLDLAMTEDDLGIRMVKPYIDVEVIGDPDIPALEDDGKSYLELDTGVYTNTDDEEEFAAAVVEDSARNVRTGIVELEEPEQAAGSYTGILQQILQAIHSLGNSNPKEDDNKDPEEQEQEELSDLGLEDLGHALVTRFPFSIPWDIAGAVKLMAAEPKAPYFEVDFFSVIADKVPWQGSTKIVIDFGQFEIIGTVCRWTSTIGFVLALAAATKRLIWTA